MPGGTRTVRRWLPAIAFILLATLTLVPTARADEPAPRSGAFADVSVQELGGWQDLAYSQMLPARSCEVLARDESTPAQFTLVLTDAELVANSDGSRFCLFLDQQWGSYWAVLLQQRSIDEFRRTKDTFLPLVIQAGIDPCAIAVWTVPETSLQTRFTRDDRNGTAYLCAPTVFKHGRVSDTTVDEVHASFEAAMRVSENLFGWYLTLPIRVHLYDSHRALVNGKRVEGGDSRVNERTYESVYGITTLLDNGMVGILVDTSAFPDPRDLRMLIAHEFAHIAQTGLLGNPNVLPFFVTEGGAEYFASLVVGADQRYLADRFWSAVADESSGRAVPLRELIARPSDTDRERMLAAYSRGYAAMRFLVERWGRDSFTRLHRENVGGTPQRFIQNLTRVTGMTLDQFDRELRTWLLAQGPVT
jgi:hypothetical protein